MKVYVARHGEASFDAATDFERELTGKGRERTTTLVSKYLADFEDVERIWCSPLVRAKETAAIFATKLAISEQVQKFLTPDADPEIVIEELGLLENSSSILLVSHQPLVGNLVNYLSAGNTYKPHPFVPSEVVVLETEIPGRGLAKIFANFLPD